MSSKPRVHLIDKYKTSLPKYKLTAMKKLLFLLLITFIIFACKNSTNGGRSISDNLDISVNSETNFVYEDEYVDANSTPQSKDINKNEPNSLIEHSKIMKEGNMFIEVENLNEAKLFIDSIINKNVGYYEKEIFKNSRHNQNYDLKIRMPSANFNIVTKALEVGIGTILDKNFNAKDVTEEYLDLEIRLDNNKAYLNRYKKLLNKATTIKEMIAIQEKIRQIEKLVDSNLGKMKYLSNKVQYSTLSIKLTQVPDEIIAEATPTFMDDILDAIQNGFSGLLFLLIVLANLWPIIVGIFIILLLRMKRHWFMKKVHVKH